MKKDKTTIFKKKPYGKQMLIYDWLKYRNVRKYASTTNDCVNFSFVSRRPAAGRVERAPVPHKALQN